MKKVTLPILKVNTSFPDDVIAKPNFCLLPELQNANWNIMEFGLATVLTHNGEITITLNMGSWDDGSEAYGTIAIAGHNYVEITARKFNYEDAPDHIGHEFSSSMLAQFYNNLVYELLSENISKELLDTGS